MSRPFPVVISGPSGVGKSTIVERLLGKDADVTPSVSITTRKRRRGEEDSREYVFVTEEEFARRREAGEFAECAEVHGNWYGTPRSTLDGALNQGRDVVLDVDYQGGLAIKRMYPEAVTIFLLPPSFAALEQRLRARASDDERTIARRLDVAIREMAQVVRYDYAVINEDIETSCGRIVGIVIGERQRASRFDSKQLASILHPEGLECRDNEA